MVSRYGRRNKANIKNNGVKNEISTVLQYFQQAVFI